MDSDADNCRATLSSLEKQHWVGDATAVPLERDQRYGIGTLMTGCLA